MTKVTASIEGHNKAEYLFEDLDIALKFVMKMKYKGYSVNMERV